MSRPVSIVWFRQDFRLTDNPALVAADLAQNTLGWQWTAGCGADAAPYFRVFNPISQGGKFDSHGNYVRKWCPELAKLPDEWIHQPHLAPREILSTAPNPARPHLSRTHRQPRPGPGSGAESIRECIGRRFLMKHPS